VLLLVQAAAGLLASVGEILLMATPLYAVLPVAKAVVLFVLASKIVRGRRWAVLTAIVLQWLGLLGVWLGVLLGLLPGLAPSITLVALLTEVALPIAVIVLCARLLITLPSRHTSTYGGAGGSHGAAYVDVWRFRDVGAGGRGEPV